VVEEGKVSISVVKLDDGNWAFNDAQGTFFQILSQDVVKSPDSLPPMNEWQENRASAFYFGVCAGPTPRQGDLYQQGLDWYVYESPDVFGRSGIIGNRTPDWRHITATPKYWVWARWTNAGDNNAEERLVRP
jgi:hypothetical protein